MRESQATMALNDQDMMDLSPHVDQFRSIKNIINRIDTNVAQ